MAQWHHIFCRSGATLPREELTEFISDSWYGDGLPDITAPPRGGTSHQLTVELPSEPPQCVDLLVDSAPETVSELVSEFLDEYGARIPRELTERLREARQVVSIRLKPDHTDDDGWELLDQTQAFIADNLDGVLAIRGEGIYDRDLRLRVDLGEASA